MRKKILFLVDGEVVLEESSETLIDTVEQMTWIICEEIGCNFDEVEVRVIDLHNDISMIDVDANGMFDWTSCYFKPYIGVKCNLRIGSNEYLDALSRNDLESYLVFY